MTDTRSTPKIGPEFFRQPTLDVARQLLGLELTYDGCSGVIVETEAYTDDPASHWVTRPNKGRLLGESHGLIYIYTIYGIHRCLNFTSDNRGPGAVLIRALEPTRGLDRMRERRSNGDTRALTSGPAKLVQALALDPVIHGRPILSHFSLRRLRAYEDAAVAASSRIGISQAQSLPWRFYVKDSPFVSR